MVSFFLVEAGIFEKVFCSERPTTYLLDPMLEPIVAPLAVVSWPSLKLGHTSFQIMWPPTLEEATRGPLGPKECSCF